VVVEVVIALVLMPVAGYAVIGAWRASRWLSESRYKPPPPRPLERLEADLRRLRAELEDTETRAGLTAKHHRVQALRGAYLDALTTACQRLEVPPPPGGDRAPQAEIYRAEAALRLRGLDVRETAVH
jgi:fructose-1,6-bisphosphatase/inositol monophosphatase family enzyme